MSVNKFHTEEFEILVPERVTPRVQRPFILTVGPSLTMIVPVLLMTMLSMLNSKAQGQSNSYFMYFSIVTGGTSCILGAIWGISNYLYQKSSDKKALMKRCDDFDEYLMKAREYLNECVLDNREYLCEKYPPLKMLMTIDDTELWQRYKKDEDFLFVRMKKGTLPFQMRIYLSENTKQLTPSEEVLRARELVEEFQFIDEVPVGIDFSKKTRLGLLESENSIGIVLGILMQLAILVDPEDLKIALFINSEKEEQRAFKEAVKFMPHLYKSDNSVRFLADDMMSTARLAGILGNAFKGMFLIVILDDEYLREESLYSHLIEEDDSFSVLFVGERSHMPNIVHDYIELNEHEIGSGSCETATFKEADILFRRLSCAYKKGYEKDGHIPTVVNFLDLFKVRRIEEIGILERWKNNRTEDGIRVPIGMISENRKMYLDVHEKVHGPHGLIAGTTGSGKSELIQTYLLSLCICYSPSEVNFFLIDYKGGGTGNVIKDLPHCAGTISNLSGYQISRAMKAIKSENIRRQKLLAVYGVNHIDAYGKLFREGTAKEPMPHLLLIIDEFAELKKEEPEFMQEIISLSAVGRSLGIHLILATQKPAGVVDDKIWSNTRFRLCLRVQDKQDSMDMLHRGEAATLVNPGQGYAQIGNNEFFTMFQTGYCGGNYTPDCEEVRIFMLDSIAERYRGTPNVKKKGPLMLKSLTEYVIKSAREGGFTNAHNLWLEPLPDVIEYRKIGNMPFGLGMYDDPYSQHQGYFEYNPGTDGHLAVAGGSGSGKSTFLKTVISQIDSKDEFLLIDLSQNEIREYENCINCLGGLWEARDISVFLYHLNKEIEARKKANGNNLYIFIDNYQSFTKYLTDTEMSLIASIFAEGLSYGTYLIVTGNGPSDFSAKIFGKIKTTICLEMNDAFWYGDMMRQYHLKASIQPGIPGRCLCRVGEEVYEGQIMLPDSLENDFLRDDSLRDDSLKDDSLKDSSLQDNGTAVSKRTFPRLPENAYVGDFIENIKKRMIDEFPIGYSLKSGLIRGYNIMSTKIFLIACEDQSIQKEIYECIEQIAEVFARYRVRIAQYSDAVKYENGSQMILFVNAVTDTGFCYSELYKIFSENPQGVYIGKNAVSQRYFDFADVPYSLLAKENGVGENGAGICGLLRLTGRKTIRILLPGKKKEETDDYD